MDEAFRKRVGILGGGQLGRMLAEAAAPLALDLAVLDPSADASASQVLRNDRHFVGDFKQKSEIERLASQVDVLTYEIEHVNADAVRQVVDESKGRVDAQPVPDTIATIQDKYRQKCHLAKHGIAISEFEDAPSAAALEKIAERFGYPLMLKSKMLAYDGRGNAVVRSVNEINSAMTSLGSRNLYAEKWVPFSKELAVMVARDRQGKCVSYPVVETVQKDNICHLVFAPAQIDGRIASAAQSLAQKAVETFDGAGVFGVEMFLLSDGSVFLNEIAPRPHNSGHYTIEACYTSQFEQHLRAVVGLPLGPCEMKTGAAVMINILGHGSGEEGLRATFKPCSVAMATPGASVHWYGKGECRRGRKMGHITVVGESMLDVTEHVQKILAAASPDAIPYPITCSPVVGVIMGSDSDLPTMRPCAQILEEFGVPFELTIVSAHRTPDRMMSYAQSAHERGLRIIIAAAGGAAHLPGMVAAITPLPVIGVPVALKYLDGMDSLYSIVQMPRGVPVATVAINNSTNAALLAIRMLGSHSPHYMQKMIEYQQNMNTTVLDKVETLNQVGWQKYAA